MKGKDIGLKNKFICSNPVWGRQSSAQQFVHSQGSSIMCTSAEGVEEYLGISDHVCVDVSTGDLWLSSNNF